MKQIAEEFYTSVFNHMNFEDRKYMRTCFKGLLEGQAHLHIPRQCGSTTLSLVWSLWNAKIGKNTLLVGYRRDHVRELFKNLKDLVPPGTQFEYDRSTMIMTFPENETTISSVPYKDTFCEDMVKDPDNTCLVISGQFGSAIDRYADTLGRMVNFVVDGGIRGGGSPFSWCRVGPGAQSALHRMHYTDCLAHMLVKEYGDITDESFKKFRDNMNISYDDWDHEYLCISKKETKFLENEEFMLVLHIPEHVYKDNSRIKLLKDSIEDLKTRDGFKHAFAVPRFGEEKLDIDVKYIEGS